MARKINISRLDVDSLMDLRRRVESALSGYRSTLEHQLEALGSSVASFGGKMPRGMRGSSLKGRKVAPKFRGPGGETWTGRGNQPRWLAAAIEEGKLLESFLIDKSAATAKKTKVKRPKKGRKSKR